MNKIFILMFVYLFSKVIVFCSDISRESVLPNYKIEWESDSKGVIFFESNRYFKEGLIINFENFKFFTDLTKINRNEKNKPFLLSRFLPYNILTKGVNTLYNEKLFTLFINEDVNLLVSKNLPEGAYEMKNEKIIFDINNINLINGNFYEDSQKTQDFSFFCKGEVTFVWGDIILNGIQLNPENSYSTIITTNATFIIFTDKISGLQSCFLLHPLNCKRIKL